MCPPGDSLDPGLGVLSDLLMATLQKPNPGVELGPFARLSGPGPGHDVFEYLDPELQNFRSVHGHDFAHELRLTHP